MEKGKLIEFRINGERRLAVVDRPEGKKDWIVIDSEGSSYKLRQQKIEYEVIGGPYIASQILEFIEDANSYLDPSSLEVAWELLVEEKRTFTSEEMANFLFSVHSSGACYAAYCLLSDDKIYFKKKGEVYEARSPGQVEEIKHQIEIENQRQRDKEVFFNNIHRRIAGEEIKWTEKDCSKLELLEKFVLQPDQNHRNAQDLLKELGQIISPNAAFDFLVSIGWWSPNENLFLKRSSYPINFPKKVLDVASSSLENLPLNFNNERIDLTHLKVYTIDDESTEEIDDGLSVEVLENNIIKLWIHIADPTYLISPGDELDLEARKRSTTLYLPTGTISMFPTELATGPMSLRQGQLCPSLSFGVILDENGAVLDYSINTSFIKPTYRLTYNDVNEILQLGITAEPELAILAKASKQRYCWRKSQGSITIKMPEASIKVKSEDEIIIDLLETSVSRQLVAEMMILAGEVAGDYCKKNNIPVPFRGQPQPELPSEEELLLLPAGPVRSCALRRCMPKGEMATIPYRHSSLGLDYYTQVTSPIRRYTDLLTHFQIKAHLSNQSLPFTLDMMQNILYSVTLSAQEASFVERQTNRYWGLEFLRRNTDQVWQGLVLRWLREDEGLGIILLEELGLELPHYFERSVQLGDHINVQVSRSDPYRDEIRFREVFKDEVEMQKI